MTATQRKILQTMSRGAAIYDPIIGGPFLWGAGMESDTRAITTTTFLSLIRQGLIRQVARAEPVAVYVAVEP